MVSQCLGSFAVHVGLQTCCRSLNARAVFFAFDVGFIFVVGLVCARQIAFMGFGSPALI